jgi:phospholipid/cholesterol/gamma-HCH transport system substrate-binding protein
VKSPLKTPRWAIALAVALLAASVLAACSVRSAGAPKGNLMLTATFDDAQNLVPGHAVQMSDVKVGSVTKVELVRGYRAKVTMSIKKGVNIPQGSSAEIAVTSLLGENFVRLALPPGGDMRRGPFLASGQQITRTRVQPQFEQVVGKAGPLIEAVANNDVGTVVEAGATALNGNGRQLNSALAKTSALLAIFGQQRQQLGVAVEQLARLGRSLAVGHNELARAPVELERTTRLLNQNKEKILGAVQELTRTARLLNDRVLEGRVLRLKRMIFQLDPVVAQLGGERQRITRLINGLVTFEQKIPRVAYDGQLLIYPILKFELPGGAVVIPEGGGGAKKPGSPLPDDLKDALPDIDDVLGGGLGPALGGGR